MTAAAQDTQENARQRILKATWTLLETSADLKVRIADIAAEAGVSRQAVYLHFGNRSNLLLAAVRHRDATADLPKAFVEAARRHPVPAALTKFVKAWFGYIPRIQPVVQLLSATSQIDPEARAAWDDRMTNLRSLILELTRRLAAAGLLKQDWSAETAADWIWHHTHADGWHHLVDERGWNPADFARRVANSLNRDLLI